jgi:glycerophosphoryl diester phosphodiesterase
MSAMVRRNAGRGAGVLDRSQFLRPIAHRGLHAKSAGRIENTACAFRAAISKGYGIECDLQAASDGTPMVFHDDRLDRLVGVKGRISRHTRQELARLHYKGQSDKGQSAGILTLGELFDLVAAQVPLLVEVKLNSATPRERFLDHIARHARGYPGPLGLMSFDRTVVAALGQLAPRVPRGPVIGSHQLPARWWAAPAAAGPTTVGRLLNRAPAGTGFLAVEVRMLRATRAWMRAQGIDLPLFAWTIRTRRERVAAARFADAPIFEGYLP